MNKTSHRGSIFKPFHWLWSILKKSYFLRIDFSVKTTELTQDHPKYKTSYIIQKLNNMLVALYHLFFGQLVGVFSKSFNKTLDDIDNFSSVRAIKGLFSKGLILQKFRAPFEKKRTMLLLIPCLFLFIDFLIRNTMGATLFASIWDELLMILLLWLYMSNEHRSNLDSEHTDTLKSFMYVYIFSGIILLIYDPHNLRISIEGFRSVYQYMFWFFLITWLVTKESELDIMDSLLVFNGLFLGLHGSYQYLAGVEMLGNWIDNTEQIRTRAFSIMYNPNALGAMLVLLIPLVLSKLLTSKTRIRQFYYGLTLVSMTMGMLFTMSRGAWLSFIMSLCIFLVLYNSKLLVHFGLLGAGAFFAFDFVSQRILYLFSKDFFFRSADGGRLEKWLDALQVWETNKVFGVGYGHYGSAVAVKNNLSASYIDSYFVKILTENGYWGLIAFILFSLGIVYLILKSIKYESDIKRKIMKIGYGASIIAVLLQSSVESLLEIPVIATYFWIILGMFFALDNINYRNYKETNK